MSDLVRGKIAELAPGPSLGEVREGGDCGQTGEGPHLGPLETDGQTGPACQQDAGPGLAGGPAEAAAGEARQHGHHAHQPAGGGGGGGGVTTSLGSEPVISPDYKIVVSPDNKEL